MLGVLLLTLAAALAFLSQRQPRYEATTEILISPVPAIGGALSGLQVLTDTYDPARNAQTAASLVQSRPAAQLAARRMPGDWTTDEVQEAVQVEPLGESDIIAVTASTSGPEVSEALANVYAEAAIDAHRSVLRLQVRSRLDALGPDASGDDVDQLERLASILEESDPTFSIASPAVAPDTPTAPPDWLVLGLAGVAGIVLASGTAVVLELTSRRVRDPNEFLDLFPMPVLTRVPRVSATSLGGMPALELPPAAQEAYRSVQVQLDQGATHARVLAVTSASAGDGKTSSTIQIALHLAAVGHRVIIMDVDLRKPDIARTLSLPAGAGIESLVTDRLRLDDVLVPAPQHGDIRVLAASGGKSDDVLLAALGHRMPDLLVEARVMAEYVLVDTSPLGEVSDALRVIPHVDEVIVVARPNTTQRPEYETMRDLMTRAGVHPLGLVLVGVGGLRGRYRAYGLNGGRTPRSMLAGARDRAL